MCGRSQAWGIRLLNSDWFQAMPRERREQMTNPAIQPNVENMVKGLAGHAMDALTRSHELLPTASIPDLIRTLKALSWTLRPGSARPRSHRRAEASLMALAQHTRRGQPRD